MTWIFATIIVVVLLLLCIYLSGIFFNKNLSESSYLRTVDTLASKSLFSYVLTKDDSGKLVYQQLGVESLNEFNGNLALKIFRDYYKEEYPSKVWLGFENENSYFGKKTFGPSGSRYEFDPVGGVYESIDLSENSTINLLLVKK